ncbi:MAG: M48 family metallopeptidase [Vicinamibacterales bacterium]
MRTRATGTHTRLSACLFLALLVLLTAAVPRAGAQQPSTTASAPDARPDAITGYHLPPDKLARAEALYTTHVAMLVVGTIYGFATLLLVLFARVAPRFRDLAERTSDRRFTRLLVFAPLFLLTLDVLGLPLGVYGHHLDVTYGLSVQGWGSWFWDWTKGELISLVLGTLLVWGLYVLLRRSPTRWWFYGWLGLIPLILLLILIGPIYIAPLFNTFSPLEEKQPQLVPELEKVMARGGLSIERSRMFEMQASEKVTTYNAYVTGIGASKRVVVWDNTAREMSVPETMFVFGHEMGHYVLQHVWLSLGVAIGALLVQLYLAHLMLGGILARWGPRWAIRDVADVASLPVLILLLSVFSLVAQPAAAAYSRYLEHQADIYGLEVTHGLSADSSQAAAHAFQKLGEKALTYPTPNPLYVFWAFDHPPVNERVRFALDYRPWGRGDRAKYVQP